MDQTKPRLLVIPHIYADDIRIREIELARRLTRRFDVYCLKWKDSLHVDSSSPARRRWVQFRNTLESLVARRTIAQAADGIQYVEAPIIQAVALHRLFGKKRACLITQAFNARTLHQTIRTLGITHLLLASGSFKLPRLDGVRTFYDFVDWFQEENAPAHELAWHRELIRQINARADAIFAVSEPLTELLQTTFGVTAIPLPNGADLRRLRGVSSAEVETVRRQWGLGDKFVLGYVGNHGDFTGVDFVLRAFQEVRRRIPNAALIIVGPANTWRPIADELLGEGVLFTGQISPEVVDAYFQALDIGILAQPRSMGTDYAFQLKVVEYSACRKFVISTPLLVWQRLKWPNVALVEPCPAAWADAVVKMRGARWEPQWDLLVEPYDWEAVADRAAALMLEGAA